MSFFEADALNNPGGNSQAILSINLAEPSSAARKNYSQKLAGGPMETDASHKRILHNSTGRENSPAMRSDFPAQSAWATGPLPAHGGHANPDS